MYNVSIQHIIQFEKSMLYCVLFVHFLYTLTSKERMNCVKKISTERFGNLVNSVQLSWKKPCQLANYWCCETMNSSNSFVAPVQEMKNGGRVQARSGKCVRSHKSSPVRTPTSFFFMLLLWKSSLADISTVKVRSYMSAE